MPLILSFFSVFLFFLSFANFSLLFPHFLLFFCHVIINIYYLFFRFYIPSFISFMLHIFFLRLLNAMNIFSYSIFFSFNETFLRYMSIPLLSFFFFYLFFVTSMFVFLTFRLPFDVSSENKRPHFDGC